MGYLKTLEHPLSTWNTILPQAACLKISCVSTVPKLRYFMERGKAWTCNIIYIDIFPKYSNLLKPTMLNCWNTLLNNYQFLVHWATESPRNGRVMPPCLSTCFGKATLHHAPHNEGKARGASAGGPTASDPEPPRGGGSDFWEGQDSLQAFPAAAEGRPVPQLGAPSSRGVTAAPRGLEAKLSSSRCVLGKGPPCLAVFPHRANKSTAQLTRNLDCV